MSRRWQVKRLPAEQRAFVEKLLREDQLSLSEMVDAIRAEFPEAPVTRSGLRRYRSSHGALARRMRDVEQAANELVGGVRHAPQGAR